MIIKSDAPISDAELKKRLLKSAHNCEYDAANGYQYDTVAKDGSHSNPNAEQSRQFAILHREAASALDAKEAEINKIAEACYVAVKERDALEAELRAGAAEDRSVIVDLREDLRRLRAAQAGGVAGQANWLSDELAANEKDTENWSDAAKESFAIATASQLQPVAQPEQKVIPLAHAALVDARMALNLALLADGLCADIKNSLRTAWLKVGDALKLKPIAQPMGEEEIVQILKDKLEVVLIGESYHGERDQIKGAKVTDASVARAARAVLSVLSALSAGGSAGSGEDK